MWRISNWLQFKVKHNEWDIQVRRFKVFLNENNIAVGWKFHFFQFILIDKDTMYLIHYVYSLPCIIVEGGVWGLNKMHQG